MSVTRYAVLVAASVATIFAASSLLLDGLGDRAHAAILFAGVAAGLNAVAAYFLARRALSRSSGEFVRLVLGGMTARMMALLAVVAAGLVVLDLPKVPLVFSLLTHFVLFLILEITLLSRRVPVTREAH